MLGHNHKNHRYNWQYAALRAQQRQKHHQVQLLAIVSGFLFFGTLLAILASYYPHLLVFPRRTAKELDHAPVIAMLAIAFGIAVTALGYAYWRYRQSLAIVPPTAD